MGYSHETIHLPTTSHDYRNPYRAGQRSGGYRFFTRAPGTGERCRATTHRVCGDLHLTAEERPIDPSGFTPRKWSWHPPVSSQSRYRGDDALRLARDGDEPQRLYSANETERIGGNEAGSISAFAIDRTDGTLKLLNTVNSGGKGPAHLSVHPSGKFVLVANYFGGSVAVLPILTDGSLGPASDIKKDEGKVGPTKATNAPPGSFAISGHDQAHAHMIEADPSGRFVLHVDLGLDKIYIWKFDDEKGLLTANEPASVSLPPGDGPRHFHFHPNGRWLYSLQEEGSTIVLFDYDSAKGKLSQRKTISSLPPGFAGSNFCSGILVSEDGRFVYAGNRLHDSIGIFSIGETGELTFVADEWTRGNYPRSFNFDPTGKFLFSCNQRGDNIAAFRVDQKSGTLEFTGKYTPVGNPSIIVFLDLAQKK
jgi:6-phosphogluconolactonase